MIVQKYSYSSNISIKLNKLSKLYLVGFMGAGKSTVGKTLSASLGYKYVDLDNLVVEKTGKKISEIFEDSGEEYFRTLESKCLAEVSEKNEKIVVSTGGGVILKPLNREIMEESGVTIYLKAAIETIWERVKNDDQRPLLSVENPYEKAKQLLEERSVLYEKSNLIVETDKLDPAQVSEKIAGILFK